MGAANVTYAHYMRAAGKIIVSESAKCGFPLGIPVVSLDTRTELYYFESTMSRPCNFSKRST